MKYIRHALPSLLLSILAACSSSSPNIQGLWKHASKPAWINIKFIGDTGSASIAQHDTNPEASGLSLMEQIERSESLTNEWRAQIYDAERDDYVDVTLVLMPNEQLVVHRNSTIILRLERAK